MRSVGVRVLATCPDCSARVERCDPVRAVAAVEAARAHVPAVLWMIRRPGRRGNAARTIDRGLRAVAAGGRVFRAADRRRSRSRSCAASPCRDRAVRVLWRTVWRLVSRRSTSRPDPADRLWASFSASCALALASATAWRGRRRLPVLAGWTAYLLLPRLRWARHGGCRHGHRTTYLPAVPLSIAIAFLWVA